MTYFPEKLSIPFYFYWFCFSECGTLNLCLCVCVCITYEKYNLLKYTLVNSYNYLSAGYFHFQYINIITNGTQGTGEHALSGVM